MDTLSSIVQEYIGSVPTDKGCRTWEELQKQMEEKIKEIMIPMSEYSSDLLPSMRAVRPHSVKVKLTKEPNLKIIPSVNPEDEGYCVRCRTRHRIGNCEEVRLKNGRLAIKGLCPKFGTGMFKILGRA